MSNHDFFFEQRISLLEQWTKQGSVIMFAGLAVAMIAVGCNGLFYHPSDVVYYQPDELGLRYEDVYFTTSDDVRLHGWFLPAEGPRPARGLVVQFHGNAANVTNHIALVAWLPPAGYDVLLFDYRGFGRSEGRVTRAGTIRDGHAALDYALTRPEYQPGRLFVLGQSLGGAVAAVVAADRPEVSAVVLEATFADYREIAARHVRALVQIDALARGIARLLISDGHDPIDVIDRISPRPLLVIAGGADTTCFPELGQKLYEAAGEPKEWLLIDEAGHFQALEFAPDRVSRAIRRTFDRGADLATPAESTVADVDRAPSVQP